MYPRRMGSRLPWNLAFRGYTETSRGNISIRGERYHGYVSHSRDILPDDTPDETLDTRDVHEDLVDLDGPDLDQPSSHGEIPCSRNGVETFRRIGKHEGFLERHRAFHHVCGSWLLNSLGLWHDPP